MSRGKTILLICDLAININVTDDILRWNKYLKWKVMIRWCQPNRKVLLFSKPGCFQKTCLPDAVPTLDLEEGERPAKTYENLKAETLQKM